MLKNILAILLIISSLCFAQSSSVINDNFNEAIQEYNSGNYDLAYSLFKKIIDSEFNSKTTIAYIFLAKSDMKLMQFQQADSILTNFLKQFPNSNYVDEANLSLADCYLEQKEYDNSFTTLIKLAESTDSSYYFNYSKETAEKIAYHHLSSYEVESRFDSTTDPKIKPIILLILSELKVKESNLASAKKYLTELIGKFPQSEERAKAENILNRISNENFSPDTKIIGILLPLSGTDVPQNALAASKEILEGIKYAVDQFNSERKGNKIGIIIRDTQFDQNKIEEIKEEFQTNPSIKAIIGPIFSNEVRIAIDDFKDLKVPIISPTATDDDLTSRSPYFFQANPPFSFRGKLMANYVYYVLNLRRVGVYDATTGYSPIIASNFVNEFTNDGGTVFTTATYKSNTFTLDSSFSKIAAFRDTLQGLYLPLSDKVDAPAILSQLVQDSLEIPIFGNQDWLYSKGLEASSDISNRLLFTSDSFIDYGGRDFSDFSNNFSAKTNMDVNRNVLYGYDTAKYLLTVLRNSGNTREDVIQKMESGITSVGFHNNISFDKSHINNYLNIIRYNNGKFDLVDRFKLRTNQ